MNLTKLVLKRPVTTVLVVLGIVVFGISSLFNFNMELIPDIQMPMMIVSTVYPGASPESIEELITEEIEDAGWINGGFMVLQPEIFEYIEGPATVFERQPLERLAAEGQLMAYQHRGFWQCMDTLREKNKLEELYASGKAPWVRW